MRESTGFEQDSDVESEEEEETQEDRAFIDDDDLEEEDDLSFYRRVDLQFPERQRPLALPAAPVQPTNPLLKKRKRLLSNLYRHLAELVVVGFNSGKYDLNVLKDILIPHLVHRAGIDLAIKRHHAYLALRTGALKFVDISNFVAAGTSYAAFLKAYQCQGEKGFFPYEHVRSLAQLEEPQLPPREAFRSWLRKSELSEEDYAVCQRAWSEKGMHSLRDFLVWYNNLDVVPFLEALDKMSQFWRRYGVDMLKEAISLPGLAFKFEMSFLKEQGLHLSSFHTQELYQLFKENMVGGPAIIFHRHAEKGQTKIRESQYGQAARPVQSVVGYDANALYLWALSQPMPVGLFTTWTPSSCGDELQPSKSWRAADEWLAWMARGLTQFRTRLDRGEKRLGPRQLPVDGYDAASQTAYGFHGCYWHGHRCWLTAKKFASAEAASDSPHSMEFLKLMRERAKRTEEKSQYLESLPELTVVSIRECQWYHQKWTDQQNVIETFLNQHFPGRSEKKQTQAQLLRRVQEGTFFGALEVDIDTPPHLRDKFSEMTPIFKNVEIERSQVGEHMQAFAEQHDIMSRPRRALIGSYKGDKILLGTPLLKFYLDQGLVVSRVHRAVQWRSHPWLEPFADFVSTSRRAADADPNQKILGETAKLVGNAGFGRFIMDLSRHQEVRYEQDESKVARAINSFFLHDLEELSGEVYELKMFKKKIKCDLPIQIGFFVFTYAKLRMLEFYYHCIDAFLDRRDFQYLEMDTDSAYMSLAGDSLEELVRPDKKEELTAGQHLWFPTTRRSMPPTTSASRAFSRWNGKETVLWG